jgi:NAD(P)-dependent dehydrogenase (short-subunit alcohol dehydrogenase family)
MLGHPGDLTPVGGEGVMLSCRLADKRCLIVGAGGIGRAAAVRFLEEGAAVALAGLDAAQGTKTARELGQIGGPVVFIPCDATDSAQVERLFDEVRGILGGLDVLYHVAGRSGRKDGDGALHECSDAGWRAALDANLTSTFLTNRAAVRHFLSEKSRGVILNMASVLALAPSPRHFDTCAYAAAKGGVIALSRQAAARYAADGVRVNVLAPGLIDTPMAARAVADPAVRQYLQTKQPLRGGPGQPDDLADAAVFLCSDEARFLTGVVLPIDGGWCVS